jgi:adenylosuccinate synthase
MKASVVIGAGYGDEGKGLVTDWLASNALAVGEKTSVVRFNGSAQAGHTVVSPGDKGEASRRHVFSHVGSGTFAGADTLLSQHFACHPAIFRKELRELHYKGIRPQITVDHRAIVITPFDQFVNVLVEAHREKVSSRHGSCGIGFGEAIERSKNPRYALYVHDMVDRVTFSDKLKLIRREWVPARLNQFDPSMAAAYASIEYWSEKDIIRLYNNFCETFLDHVNLDATDWVFDWAYAKRFDHLIFEGAQGLMLDQDYGHFPHVTRSNTGLKNVLAMTNQDNPLDVYYVTRAYTTRHGRGPLPHECLNGDKPHVGVHDYTNVTNPHQGHLRYGYLDLNVLTEAIKHDLRSASLSRKIRYSLVITCLDQVDYNPTWVVDGKRVEGILGQLIDDICKLLPDIGQIIGSGGPTRDTIGPMYKNWKAA